VQLFSTLSQHAASSNHSGSVKLWWPRRAQSSRGSTGPQLGGFQLLLLHRIGDVMLKTIRSGRPLIHVMRAWSVVGPHLMEVSQSAFSMWQCIQLGCYLDSEGDGGKCSTCISW
jgi:hypothetical protein